MLKDQCTYLQTDLFISAQLQITAQTNYLVIIIIRSLFGDYQTYRYYRYSILQKHCCFQTSLQRQLRKMRASCKKRLPAHRSLSELVCRTAARIANGDNSNYADKSAAAVQLFSSRGHLRFPLLVIDRALPIFKLSYANICYGTFPFDTYCELRGFIRV